MSRLTHFAALLLLALGCGPLLAQEGDVPRDRYATEDGAIEGDATKENASSSFVYDEQPDLGDSCCGCAQCDRCGAQCDRSQAQCDRCGAQTAAAGGGFGLRNAMQQRGITFAGKSTHFGFGVGGGIDASPVPALGPGDVFLYTGRGEYDALFDLEKFGGLPHGKLLARLEHWYGEYGNVSLRTGALSPAVFAASLPPAPDNPGSLYLTNFVITQPLSENFVIYGGKKDVLGAADQDVFAGGDGTDQFVNQAFVANPAFLLGLPYTGFVAGAAMPQDWGMMSVFAYDPKDRTQDVFELDDLYAKGVIVGGEIKFNTNLFQRTGQLHVGGMWKHVDLTDLRFAEPPPGVYPEPVVPGFPTLPDSWTIYTGFDQYLVKYAGQADKGWGVFGRASISDGNPTPVRYFLSCGVGGDSTLRRGKNDRWGVGWYYVGASNEFGPLPQFLFGPRDGAGLELYHNFQVNRSLYVTPDLQFLKPEAGGLADFACVYGVRANVAW